MTSGCAAALALPLPNAHFIWYCAWLAVPSAIYSYSHPASTHLAIVPTSVWATSLLYWQHPLRDSWRRTLDMAVVFTGLTYNTYYAVRHASPRSWAAWGRRGRGRIPRPDQGRESRSRVTGPSLTR